MLQSSTGRRPTQSESRPQIGMKRNCMMEKTAPGMVAMKSPAPRRRAMPGRNGITSPKPSRSRKIVRNSVLSEAVAQGLPLDGGWTRRWSSDSRPNSRWRGSRPPARATTRRRWRAARRGWRRRSASRRCARRRGAAGAVRERAAARRRDPRTFSRRAWRRTSARAGETPARRTRAESRPAAGAAPRSRARAADRPACATDLAASSGRRRPPTRRLALGQRLQLGLDPLAGDRGEQVIAVHQPEPLVELEERRHDRQRAARFGEGVERAGERHEDEQRRAGPPEPHQRWRAGTLLGGRGGGARPKGQEPFHAAANPRRHVLRGARPGALDVDVIEQEHVQRRGEVTEEAVVGGGGVANLEEREGERGEEPSAARPEDQERQRRARAPAWPGSRSGATRPAGGAR